jgi:hypothetical protein
MLSSGSKAPLELFEAIKEEGRQISYQAVYKALKYLITETVVVKSGKEIAISQEWINKLSSQLSGSFILPPLAIGESVSYSYVSLTHLDAYWKHINKALEQKYLDFPIFIYNPYGIWLHLNERYQSEVNFLSEFANNKQYAFLVLGNDSALDQSLKQNYQNNFLQVDLWKNSSLPETDYFTINGDYIITTKLNKKLAPKITTLYKSLVDINKSKAELEHILKFPNKSKLKLEYNPQKAKMLRKKLFKNFYLPTEQKAKHELF